MKRLEIIGVDFAELTLHVGLGTFRPIMVEDLTRHQMDSEYFSIPKENRGSNIFKTVLTLITIYAVVIGSIDNAKHPIHI